MQKFDAAYQIQLLYNLLSQQQRNHMQEKQYFIAQFQQYRQMVQSSIAEIQQQYQRQLVLILNKENSIKIYDFEAQLNNLQNKSKLENIEILNKQLLKDIQILKEEKTTLSKLIQNITNQQDKGPAKFEPKKYKFNPKNVLNDTKLSGDELDFRHISVTISEDVETYKMTRNPINKDGFYSLQGGYYCEDQNNIIVKNDKYKLRNQISEVEEGIKFITKNAISQQLIQQNSAICVQKTQKLLENYQQKQIKLTKLLNQLQVNYPEVKKDFQLLLLILNK